MIELANTKGYRSFLVGKVRPENFILEKYRIWQFSFQSNKFLSRHILVRTSFYSIRTFIKLYSSSVIRSPMKILPNADLKREKCEKVWNFIKRRKNWRQARNGAKWNYRSDLRHRQIDRADKFGFREENRSRRKSSLRENAKQDYFHFERWKWERRAKCRLAVSFRTRRIVNWKGRVVRGPPKQTCANVFDGDLVYVRFLLISTASETKVSLFRLRFFFFLPATSIILEYKFQDLIVRRPWPGRFICNSSIAPRQRSITSFDLTFSIITTKIVPSFVQFAMQFEKLQVTCS